MKQKIQKKLRSLALPVSLITLLNVHQKANAQYITLPDGDFYSYIAIHYSTCITYDYILDINLLDTTCTEILEETVLDLNYEHLHDLDGIHYFKGLTNMGATNNYLTALPKLPNSLESFSVAYNQIETIEMLPASSEHVDLGNNYITSLPPIPEGTKYINLDVNYLTELPELPASLMNLSCYDNDLTELPELPENLYVLHVPNNPITELPELPDNELYYINCESCLLTELPELPVTLRELFVDYCEGLTCLPLLPDELEKTGNYGYSGEVLFTGTGITCIPNIPLACTMYGSTHPICEESDPVDNPNECLALAPVFSRNTEQTMIENTAPVLEIHTFPNPTSGAFSFYLPQQLADAGANATIYNIAGEKVSEYFLTNEGVVTLDLSAENSGVYFMKIQSAEQIITCKLIKQ